MFIYFPLAVLEFQDEQSTELEQGCTATRFGHCLSLAWTVGPHGLVRHASSEPPSRFHLVRRLFATFSRDYRVDCLVSGCSYMSFAGTPLGQGRRLDHSTFLGKTSSTERLIPTSTSYSFG